MQIEKGPTFSMKIESENDKRAIVIAVFQRPLAEAPKLPGK